MNQLKVENSSQEEIMDYSEILNRSSIIDEITTFITVSMVGYFQSIGIRQDFINSIIKIDELNPYIIFQKSKTLSMLMNKKEGRKLLAAYKRIDSILKESVLKNIIYYLDKIKKVQGICVPVFLNEMLGELNEQKYWKTIFEHLWNIDESRELK